MLTEQQQLLKGHSSSALFVILCNLHPRILGVLLLYSLLHCFPGPSTKPLCPPRSLAPITSFHTYFYIKYPLPPCPFTQQRHNQASYTTILHCFHPVVPYTQSQLPRLFPPLLHLQNHFNPTSPSASLFSSLTGIRSQLTGLVFPHFLAAPDPFSPKHVPPPPHLPPR